MPNVKTFSAETCQNIFRGEFLLEAKDMTFDCQVLHRFRLFSLHFRFELGFGSVSLFNAAGTDVMIF
jgi:hypothetical protein